MSEIRDGNVDIIPGRGYAHKWRQSYPRQIDPVFLNIFFAVYYSEHNYLYAHNGRGAAELGSMAYFGGLWTPWQPRLVCHCPAAILIPHYIPSKFSEPIGIISQRPLSTLAVYRWPDLPLCGQATPYSLLNGNWLSIGLGVFSRSIILRLERGEGGKGNL